MPWAELALTALSAIIAGGMTMMGMLMLAFSLDSASGAEAERARWSFRLLIVAGVAGGVVGIWRAWSGPWWPWGLLAPGGLPPAVVFLGILARAVKR